MSKRFWRRPPVSKLLKSPKDALKRGFFGGTGRGLEAESLLERLPDLLAGMNRGIEILDGGFPIREGASRVDYLARDRDGELIFLWLKPALNGESISKVLPDYDWVQKNQALWPHLFPELLQHRSLRLQVWLVSFQIDPDIHCFLSYLSGIQLKLFHARRGRSGEGLSWHVSPWNERVARTSAAIELPSSPSVLSLLPSPAAPAPGPSEDSAHALLSKEELKDLLGVAPGAESWQPDEVTDPYYLLNRERD